MIFSSIIFVFYFLPLFLLGYYLSGLRVSALLAGSVAFYVWSEGAYIFLLLGLIALNYAGSRWLSATVGGRLRLAILIGLVVADVSVLGFFKYAEFLAHSLNAVLPGRPLPEIHQALPLGISFFTFQLLSYVVDVHRGSVRVERDPARFAAYIVMFPHLIAGPIVRYADIRDEMHADRRRTTYTGLGVQYFIVGLSQKILVANTVAPLADHAFATPLAGLGGVAAWLGLWAYSLQIYFDFCGYSNMAIGLAFLLGFSFPKNFDYPYASQSITDFWRRWHMTLTSWFRDYVYIPLGGNRHGQRNTVRNLLLVFFLTGLWHGAAWRFIVWGFYHGTFLMLERLGLVRALERVPRLVRHSYAIIVVMLGWVFFRADSLPHALGFLGSMLNPTSFRHSDVELAITANAQVLAALGIGSVLAFPVLPGLMERLGSPRAEAPSATSSRLDTRSVHALPVALLAAAFVLSVAFMAGSTLTPFLYFKF